MCVCACVRLMCDVYGMYAPCCQAIKSRLPGPDLMYLPTILCMCACQSPAFPFIVVEGCTHSQSKGEHAIPAQGLRVCINRGRLWCKQSGRVPDDKFMAIQEPVCKTDTTVHTFTLFSQRNETCGLSCSSLWLNVRRRREKH